MTGHRNFASDNNSGIHPEILQALQDANQGHAIGYGDDRWTAAAMAGFREHFGEPAEVFFVFSGTAANVLSLKAVTRPYHAVICAAGAHLDVDECGAPEALLGCKLLPLATPDGKLRPEQLPPLLRHRGDQHQVQPRVISITQATELGTVYTPDEIRALATFAHENGLLLHVDGARLANAAAHLELPLKAITTDAGVDVLSFGGTKNGMMLGEAVVFFAPDLARDFPFIRKQGMQLGAKMRFLAAQFTALLAHDLWRRNARHANAMARLLADKLEGVAGVRLTQEVQANAVFARVPPEAIPALREKYFFYVWNEETSEVRWMTTFDTTAGDVEDFAQLIRDVAG